MRKQFVILDSCEFNIAVAEALFSFAALAKSVGYADIKLLLPTMLRAEYKNGAAQLRNKKTIDNPRLVTRLGLKTPRKLFGDYHDYIFIPQLSETEVSLIAEMTPRLTAIYQNNQTLFYNIMQDRNLSIVRTKKDISEALANNSQYFCNAYCYFMNVKEFISKLGQLDLLRNLADRSIIAWYESLIASHDTSEVIIVSSDNELLEKMKTIYTQQDASYAGGNPNNLNNLDHFVQTSFTVHIIDELKNMKETTSLNTEQQEQLKRCEERCNTVIEAYKPKKSDIQIS